VPVACDRQLPVDFATMPNRVHFGPESLRWIRHWAAELATVAVGVLLALWAQAWFEGRVEKRVHRDTVEQMDDLIGRALVLTAARVSASECATRRIAELDEALRSSNGQWAGMPLARLPESMAAGHFRYVYVADSDVLPLEVFDTARRNGTLAALPPEVQRYYVQVERQLAWLNDVWNSSDNPGMRLSVLSVEGPLGEDARDRFRQDLAWLGSENQVTVQRARSLALLARDRGVTLSTAELADYRRKVERDRQFFGDCIAEVEPLTLVPVAVAGASGP
jgi:hypothetical protein